MAQLRMRLEVKDDKSICDKCGHQNMVTNWKVHRHSNIVTLIYKCRCERVRLDWITSEK